MLTVADSAVSPRQRKLAADNCRRVEIGFDNSKFKSWLIYLATTEEDQQKIWGNPAIIQKYGLNQPVESIDVLLRFGEKDMLSELVGKISGVLEEDDEDGETKPMSPEEYAKN